jgi:hypothetical protein
MMNDRCQVVITLDPEQIREIIRTYLNIPPTDSVFINCSTTATGGAQLDNIQVHTGAPLTTLKDLL